jgi:hypothetical protein
MPPNGGVNAIPFVPRNSPDLLQATGSFAGMYCGYCRKDPQFAKRAAGRDSDSSGAKAMKA